MLGIFGSLKATSVSIEIASPGNIYSSQPYATEGDFYVGPYTLVVNGETMLGMCVDFYHQSGVDEPWSAFQTPVTPTAMNNTYVYQRNAGSPNVNAVTLQTYQEETYLFSQIIAALLPAERAAIQEAAWSITDPGFSISDEPAAKLWVAAAENPSNFLNVNLTGIVIYSDIRGGEQEFIAYPVNTISEPGALSFLAGLLGFAYVTLRHRR